MGVIIFCSKHIEVIGEPSEIVEIDNATMHQVLRDIAAGNVEIIKSAGDEEFQKLINEKEQKHTH